MKPILVYSIFLILYSCMGVNKQEKKNSIWDEFQGGWAGHPSDRKSKPFDYFYMKTDARASEQSLRKKHGNMMKTTCLDNATVNSKGDFIGRIAGDSASNCNDKLFQDDKISFRYKSIPTFPVWNLVSTTHDGESTGVFVVRELMELPLKLQILACRPLALPDPEIPLSEFKECECIIYSHIPCGRDSIIELWRKYRE